MEPEKEDEEEEDEDEDLPEDHSSNLFTKLRSEDDVESVLGDISRDEAAKELDKLGRKASSAEKKVRFLVCYFFLHTV